MAKDAGTLTIDALVAENTALKAELAALKGTAAPAPKPYPSVRYHKDGVQTCTVLDEASDAGLGASWYHTPQAAAADAYPAWRYHGTEPPRMVKNADEDRALGSGWKKPSDL